MSEVGDKWSVLTLKREGKRIARHEEDQLTVNFYSPSVAEFTTSISSVSRKGGSKWWDQHTAALNKMWVSYPGREIQDLKTHGLMG